MELKKSIKADLEWRKPLFFQIGLVLALLAVYLAFEFIGTTEKEDAVICGTRYISDEIVVMQPIDLPPPPANQANTSIEIAIASNAAEADNFTIDVESNENLRIYDIEDVEYGGEKTDIPFLFVEVYPEFPGGDDARIDFLHKHLNYPQSAREAGLEGIIFVEFIVEKDGRLTNFSITRGVAPVLDNEVLRVLKMMPKWKPGQQRGKAVRVQYQMPVTFALK